MVQSYKFLGHFEALAHLHDYTLRRGLGRAMCQWGLFILPRPLAVLHRERFWQHKGLEVATRKGVFWNLLQRQGFWQHKGLEKHNKISVASSIVTCNGLATLKGSPPGCRYQFRRRRIGLCWVFSSWSPDCTKSQDQETHSMITFYFTSRFSLWTHSQCT